MSILLKNLSNYFERSKLDLFIIYGDRMESSIGSIVALNFQIPICHFQGGDLSGNIDEKKLGTQSQIVRFTFNIEF